VSPSREGRQHERRSTHVRGADVQPVAANLRAAGAVILGKTNLSEWANFRGFNSTSGWSGAGGLTNNPYVLDRTARTPSALTRAPSRMRRPC